jgi:Mg-chelatase subunit ChlD
VVGFTSNTEEIQNRLVFTQPKGRTALLDGVYMAMNHMKKARNPRKAIIILSDGGDNSSRYTESEVRNLVREADVQIYAIGIFESMGGRMRTAEEASGPGLLSELAESTGGRHFPVDNLNELPDVAAKIGIELRNQYVLGYTPINTAKDGKYRRVQVKLKQPKGFLRSRRFTDLVTMPRLSSFCGAGHSDGAGNVCGLRPGPGNHLPFRTRLVVLHASVLDKTGKLLTALPRSAFKVYENNVEQPIKLFTREDIPVSLGLVIDNSGSMRNRRKRVEEAALAAVKASNPRDEVTVVNFNDDSFQDVELTSDLKKMEEGLTKIDSRGGTAMRDAVSATIDYLKKKGKHNKKVLFVVTDGNDTASTQITLERLVQKAHDSEVLLYFIGLLNEEDKREAKKAKRAMEALANASVAYPSSRPTRT